MRSLDGGWTTWESSTSQSLPVGDLIPANQLSRLIKKGHMQEIVTPECEGIAEAQLQVRNFVYIRSRLTENDVDQSESIPGPDMEWMHVQARLIVKFTEAGRPVVMLVARDRNLQKIVPEAVHRKLFLQIHCRCHRGINMTISRIQEEFVWPGIKEDITDVLRVQKGGYLIKKRDSQMIEEYVMWANECLLTH